MQLPNTVPHNPVLQDRILAFAELKHGQRWTPQMFRHLHNISVAQQGTIMVLLTQDKKKATFRAITPSGDESEDEVDNFVAFSDAWEGELLVDVAQANAIQLLAKCTQPGHGFESRSLDLSPPLPLSPPPRPRPPHARRPRERAG
ncbi:unnamed protein product [Cutaneotrichosporon oleaginosum]